MNSVSIYKPVEIEINGVKYTLRKLNRKALRALAEDDQAYRAEPDPLKRMDLLYAQVEHMIDAPAEVIDDLDFQQLQEIVQATSQLLSKEKTDETKTPEELEEKNAPKPGDAPAA